MTFYIVRDTPTDPNRPEHLRHLSMSELYSYKYPDSKPEEININDYLTKKTPQDCVSIKDGPFC
jgi:uncharacterized protein YfaT (DUF1175 family)